MTASPVDAARAPSVVEQIEHRLAEHLLPVRGRKPGEDAPHLLAVDASGQLVVVEVVPRLDEAACLRALRYAGRAARMSSQDVARAYRGGAERFAGDLARFQESAPASSLLAPVAQSGVRLLLVCADVDPATQDLLDFLLQPRWQVDVLRITVQEGPDGRRVVDAAPVTRTPAARTALAPAVLVGARPARPLRDLTPADPHTSRSELRPAPAAPRRPAVVPPPFAVRVGTAEQAEVPAPVAPAPDTPAAVAPAAADRGLTPAGDAVDPELLAIARELAPAALVWTDPHPEGRPEALLHDDGVIELTDGTRHGDPRHAAAAAAGAEHVARGWELWRVDPIGPTLAELRERLRTRQR